MKKFLMCCVLALIVSGCSSESAEISLEAAQIPESTAELAFVELTSCDRLAEIDELASFFFVEFLDGTGPSAEKLAEMSAWDSATVTTNRSRLTELYEDIKTDTEATEIHDAIETLQPLMLGLYDLGMFVPKEDPEVYVEVVTGYALGDSGQPDEDLVGVVEAYTALEVYQEANCSGI